jgi:hypothetical protein
MDQWRKANPKLAVPADEGQTVETQQLDNPLMKDINLVFQ